MADNILGPEVNLGLNVNLELDKSAQDAATLADQIKQMRVDQEAFRDVIADTNDRLREMTSEFQEQLSLRQQMLDAEQSLRNLSDSRTQSLQDQVNAYREMEQSMSRLGQTMAGASMPYIGGMGGMGGMSGFYGGMGGGFYNPMSGMMGNFGGFPSAFSGTPAEEAMEAEEIYQAEEGKGMLDRARQRAQDLFYFGNLPDELEKLGRPDDPNNPDRDLRNTNLLARFAPRLAGRIAALSAPGGALSRIGPIAERFAGPVSGGFIAYQALSHMLRTGQEYGALTGDFNVTRGYESDIQARIGSFLNPLLPYGVSKEIESTGLASGYQYGSKYLNDYRSFASGAFERYQMSPGETQQLFQNGVIKAGASLKQLTDALHVTAKNAADAGVSFQTARKTMGQALDVYSGMGFNGATATAAASMLTSLPGSGKQGQILQNVMPQIANFQNSMVGQALMANQIGTSYTNLYAKEKTMNSEQLMGATTGTLTHLMSNMGINSKNIDQNTPALTLMLQSMGMNVSQKEAATLANLLIGHPSDAMLNTLAPHLHKPKLDDYPIVSVQHKNADGTYSLSREKDYKDYNKDMNIYHEKLKKAEEKYFQGFGNQSQTVIVKFTGMAEKWLQQNGPKNMH